VRRLRRDGKRVIAIEVDDPHGSYEVEGRYFLSSAPLTDIIEMMEPSAPLEVLSACHALRYRNHLGVNLIVQGCPFPDNWIYVHSKHVGMARIANYANFSAAMSGRAGISPLTVEYFCFPHDQLWQAPDANLIEHACRELTEMKILQPDQVLSGFVVRSDKAYPVLEIGYERHIETIKSWLDQFLATGLLAARTALGVHRYDPWLVNIDAEYHEGAAAPQVA
jgi:protoporphyrinogen oxidase